MQILHKLPFSVRVCFVPSCGLLRLQAPLRLVVTPECLLVPLDLHPELLIGRGGDLLDTGS